MNLHWKHLFGLAFVLTLALAACSGGASTENPTEAPTEAPTPEPEMIDPSVAVSDQDASLGTVSIDLIHASDPGWLVVHADNDGGPGVVLGHSQVNVGDNHDVVVEIDLSQATPVLHAMLHLDAGTVGEYEFPGDDAPVFVGDTMVNVPFNADLGPGLVTDMGEEYSVEIQDGRFDQNDLAVPVGATVVWSYEGSLPHTVTAENGEFDSGTMDKAGTTFSFTFTEAGVYPYYCIFHGSPGGGGMSGRILVGDVGDVDQGSDSGGESDDLDDLY